MTKKIKLNLSFIGAFFLIMFLMYGFSNKYFLDDYESIESIHNENSVKDLVNNLNLELRQIQSISNAYSRWDNAYEYLTNQSNENFIYKNFRHGVKYINQLNIDFLIYADKKNNLIYYETTNLIAAKKNFAQRLVRKYTSEKLVQTTFRQNDNVFYVLKKKVLRTDGSGDVGGYLYVGKALNKELFNYANSIFTKASLVKENVDFSTGVTFYNNTNKIRLKTIKTDRHITNYLELRDYLGVYITTIKTVSLRDYILEAKKAILLYNIIVSMALLIIFFIVYKYQSFLHNYTEKLENSVKKRTIELEKTNNELHCLAYKDFLTKLDNRRSFFLKIDKLLRDKIFRKNLVHIVMIDIDNFKQINDKYSHNIGDLVLKEFAGIIQDNISHDDTCARLGGEEFVIAFTEISTQKVLEKVEEIRKKTEERKIEFTKNKYFTFTASFGISDNSKTNNIDKILHKADSYLYEVKKSGKNNIRYRK